MIPFLQNTPFAILAAATLVLGGCAGTIPAAETAPEPERAPRTVQAGAPGEASRPVDQATATRLPYTEADVRFMQGMIHHHAQAVEMVALVHGRTTNPELVRLAHRIDVSQTDEIAFMQNWLAERGEEVPEVHAGHAAAENGHGHGHGLGHGHHGPGHDELMPGMLSPEQMGELAAASGAEFDRLFLEFMIFHHEGALFMVEELFSSPRAGQQSEIFHFASHVDSDQRIEIERMLRMLREMQD
jgi:uncharacterized protein (DUF305 family)